MYKSIEVRWFLKEEPQMLGKWFTKWNEDVYGDNERIDFYLDVEGYTDLSFKLREGKTELKSLTEVINERAFNKNCKGIVEKWVKWGPELKEDLKDINKVFKEPQSFVEMKKGRVLLKFEVLADNSLRKADKTEEDLKEGCQVELTRLDMDGKTSYTFGLEAFGSDEKLLTNFNIVSEKIFNELQGIDMSLSVKDSYSYPVFLSHIKNTVPWK